MSNPSKVPPHNLEAERSVLGAVMIEKNAIVKVADFLMPEDFYYDTHATIYSAILDLFAKRSPIDLLTVGSWLKDNGKLDEVGGASYLEELTNEVLTA